MHDQGGEVSIAASELGENPAFCVGAPKSGTHSIAELFGGAMRTAHEPHALGMIRLILANPRPTSRERRAYFRNRHDRLRLQLESTHMLVFFLEELLACFPGARFLLTVRDPKSWLDSFFNQQLGTPVHAEWKRFRDYRFGRSLYGHFTGAEILRENGLYPLDSYLAYWAWHNERVLRIVPPGQLMIVRTPDIAANAARMAEYLGVDPQRLAERKTHAFKAAARFDLVSRIDPALLDDRIAAHCGHLIGKLEARMLAV